MASYRIPKNERPIPMERKPRPATKITKLNRPEGGTVISAARGRRRARRMRNANRAKANDAGAADLEPVPRAALTKDRPYARGNTGPRGAGRVQGVTLTDSPTSRADLLKQGPRARTLERG